MSPEKTFAIPDLSGVDLRHAELSGANLVGARFENSNLTRANLRGADLFYAKLKNAKLSGVRLRNANLNLANLSGADLSYVRLYSQRKRDWMNVGSDLRGANFCNANLSDVNFDRAVVGDTVFGNSNLTGAKNLEKCLHGRPSIIDHNTFLISGNLPIEFVRGCGLPDDLIKYYTSLQNQSERYYSCFISYSHKNEVVAQKIYTDLQNNGVRCWYSPDNMKIGDKIRLSLDNAIQKHDKLLLVLSEYSINSQWVEQEVEKALEQEREQPHLVLFPIRLDNTIFNTKLGWASLLKNTRNIGDFTKWEDRDFYEKAFNRLIVDLKKG